MESMDINFRLSENERQSLDEGLKNLFISLKREPLNFKNLKDRQINIESLAMFLSYAWQINRLLQQS